MTHTMRERIVHALDSVEQPDQGQPDALLDLADLVFLTTLVDQLSERAQRQLAARPTVTAHLGQARDQVAQLRRSLTHATETLAFNTAQRSPLYAEV